MKILLLFLSLFFFFSSFKTLKVNDLDFRFAENYCKEIEKEAKIISKKYDLKTSEIIPVIFPECSRFSSLSNIFETSILEYFYVENGAQSKNGADYSIGYFQMKPSFIEHLEKIIQKDDLFAKKKSFFAYKSKVSKEIRNERLNRLKNQTWQLEYLCCFVKHMKNRFIEEKIESDELSFIASAYNYGFHKSSKEIIEWQEVKAFPNGIKNKAENFSYAELAKHYHDKTYN
ncbi:MAG: hypothetical protein V4622_11170 [Bacteroidota bacterium]